MFIGMTFKGDNHTSRLLIHPSIKHPLLLSSQNWMQMLLDNKNTIYGATSVVLIKY